MRRCTTARVTEATPTSVPQKETALLCRAPAAAEGREPRVDGAHAQQAADAGGHLQGVSALQRPGPRGHRHGPLRPGGARPEELAEPPG